jgi:hypothetical protein
MIVRVSRKEVAQNRLRANMSANEDDEKISLSANSDSVETEISSPSSVDRTSAPPRRHLQELLDARGIGIKMAAGIDLGEYLRELREDGLDEREQALDAIYAEIEAQKRAKAD